jgi:glycosyltransferase involved in cell wall biosynthesis
MIAKSEYATYVRHDLRETSRRFAFLCPNYHPLICGVGDFSMRLGRELMRRGTAVAIFTHTPASPHPEAPDLPVYASAGPTPLVIAERLRHLIDQFRPTHLLIQYTPQMLGAWRWGSPAIPWLAMTARRHGTKVVVLAHELFLPWSRRPDLVAGAALLRAQLVALLATVDRFLVTMEMRVDEVASYVRIARHPWPVGVVRIGSNALPRPREIRPGRLRMGVFSTLASTKRFDVVLDCFAVVQKRVPHAELVLLGDLADTAQPHVRALLQAVAAHPSRAQIRVPGKQELSEIAEEVAHFDVYLFPMISGANTRSSTLPLPFGAGVPVVAVKSYETDGLFVDRENIMFSTSLSGGDFAAAVWELIDDPMLADRVSAGGRRLYQEYFAWERVADQFLAQIETA